MFAIQSKISLSSKYKILLNRFRLELINDLNAVIILDYLCIFSHFPLDIKTAVLSLTSEVQRNATLIDQIEMLDDSVFIVFLNALREHNIQLYNVLLDSSMNLNLIDTVSEPDNSVAIQKFIKEKLPKYQSNKYDVDSNQIFSKYTESENADRTVVPAATECENEFSVIYQLRKDVVFVKADLCHFPNNIRKPFNVSTVYVFDWNNKHNNRTVSDNNGLITSSNVNESSDNKNTSNVILQNVHKRSDLHVFNNEDDISTSTAQLLAKPPPLPPKPAHLPLLNCEIVPRSLHHCKQHQTPMKDDSSNLTTVSVSNNDDSFNKHTATKSKQLHKLASIVKSSSCHLPHECSQSRKSARPLSLPHVNMVFDKNVFQSEKISLSRSFPCELGMLQVEIAKCSTNENLSTLQAHSLLSSSDLTISDSQLDCAVSVNSSVSSVADQDSMEQIYVTETKFHSHHGHHSRIYGTENGHHSRIYGTENAYELVENETAKMNCIDHHCQNNLLNKIASKGLEQNTKFHRTIDSSNLRHEMKSDNCQEVHNSSPTLLDKAQHNKKLDRWSIADSHYELIDSTMDDFEILANPVGYLEPVSSAMKTTMNNSIIIVDPDFVELRQGFIVISDSLPLIDSKFSEWENEAMQKVLSGTRLCMDKMARTFYIPAELLKPLADHRAEAWFYPVAISSRQATLFLSEIQQDGCFVVYEPLPKSAKVVYNLSVCLQHDIIVHYHIIQNVFGEFFIEGHNKKFMTLCALVEFFKLNKSDLSLRLRRGIKEFDLPIFALHPTLKDWEINRLQLRMSGQILNQYEMGTVYAGEYKNKTVAVKILKNSTVTISAEDSFLDELMVMVKLNNINIVRLIGVSLVDRPFLFVTEHASRGTLRDCLKARVIPIHSVSMLLHLCIQATQAVHYLTSWHYILHRNLMANKFMVFSPVVLKLADFSRACYVTDDEFHASKHEIISVKWAAPEVLMNSLYSSKSEIWSLGIVLWEIFSYGERPFAGKSIEETVLFVINGGRLQKPLSCFSDLYVLLQQCWLDATENRISCSALCEKLQNLLKICSNNSSDCKLPRFSSSNVSKTSSEFPVALENNVCLSSTPNSSHLLVSPNHGTLDISKSDSTVKHGKFRKGLRNIVGKNK